MTKRFIPKKYLSHYDLNWNEHFLWGVWDNETKDWSNYLCHGKYKTKKDCIWCINKYNLEWSRFSLLRR